MPHIIWSPGAERDIVRLRAFLQAHDSEAARRAVARIRASVRILARHPLIGKPVETLPDFHEWSVRFGRGSYIVRYKIIGEAVVILLVRHAREDN